MKRLLTILIASLFAITAFTTTASATSFNDLDSYQKQKFWQMWEKDCYQLLVDQKYSDYFTCSTSTLKNASKLVQKVSAWCKDTDNGMNYFEKGTVTSDVYPNGVEDYFYTFSNGKTYLIEGACSANNRYMYYQKNCSELDIQKGGKWSNGDGVCEKASKLHAEIDFAGYFPDYFVPGEKEVNSGKLSIYLDQKVNFVVDKVVFNWIGGNMLPQDIKYIEKGNPKNYKKFYLYTSDNYSQPEKLIATSTLDLKNNTVTFDNLNYKDNTDTAFLLLFDANTLTDGAKLNTVDAFDIKHLELYSENKSQKITWNDVNLSDPNPKALRKAYPTFQPAYMPQEPLLNGNNLLVKIDSWVNGNSDVAVASMSFSIYSSSKELLNNISSIKLTDKNGSKITLSDTNNNISESCLHGEPSKMESGQYTYSITVSCIMMKPFIMNKDKKYIFELNAKVNNPQKGQSLLTTASTPILNKQYITGYYHKTIISNLSAYYNVRTPEKTYNGEINFDPMIWSDISNNMVNDWAGDHITIYNKRTF